MNVAERAALVAHSFAQRLQVSNDVPDPHPTAPAGATVLVVAAPVPKTTFDCNKPKTRNPRNAGRPTHRAEQVPEEVTNLIKTATTKEPGVVAQWLRRKLNAHMDEELEVLASHVLSEAGFEDVLELPEVRGPMGRGDTETAARAIISRMKRKFAKLLRDHERSENDDFLDEVQVVD